MVYPKSIFVVGLLVVAVSASSPLDARQAVYCPGVLENGSDCCVGGNIGFQSCFPFCSDSSQGNDASTYTCVTRVPLTASGYSSIVSAAASSASAGSPASNVATTTTSKAGIPKITGQAQLVIGGVVAALAMAA